MNLMPFEGDAAMLADRFELCLYKDGAAGSTGSAAFAPGCPGGVTLQEYSRSSPDVRFVSFTVDFPPTGLIGFGGNSARIGASSPIYASGAWIGYVEGDPAATGPPPVPPAVTPPPPSMLELRSRRLRRAGSRVLVPVRCPGAARCRGTLAVGSGRPAAYDVAAGSVRTLRAPLPRRLRRAKRAAATLSLVAIGDQAQQTARVRVSIGRLR